jgi:hypothetical protein
MGNMMRAVLALALVLVLALAPAVHAEALTNAAVLDLLNVAHAKLEAGDKDGAKADLKSLAGKLDDSSNPAHKRWKRSIGWIVLELSIGMTQGADNNLHTLIREVSTADSAAPPYGSR